MINGGKDKASSWVNSQMTDPPEAPPIVPTVVDLPAPPADVHVNSLSSDEEARRRIRRRSRRYPKYHGYTDAEIEERRARHREARRAEREAPRSSEGSGDGDRYVIDGRHRHAAANGVSAKRSSWFKNLF
jgi:hypothetical protein